MDKKWFEMRDEIRRKHADSVWIPLKVLEHYQSGKHGYLGWKDEFIGVRTLAVHQAKRAEGEKLTWVSMMQDPVPYADKDGRYKPADTYEGHENEALGVSLVLPQSWSGLDHYEWHLNQDLVLALGLLREGDVWVCPSEGFINVVKLTRDEKNSPSSIVIRADFLRDYLAARGLVLRITCHRSRDGTVEDASFMGCDTKPIEENIFGGRFRSQLIEIHEGGLIFGAETAVFHMSRTDVDTEADMPVMGPENNDNVHVESWTKKDSGRKLMRINTEFKRDEWVEPAAKSPRVRKDEVPSNVSFAVDASGEKVSADTLNDEDVGKWLWFSPDVIPRILTFRESALSWYTRETGSIDILESYPVHFGVNSKGLINVYAYDIAKLPEWQRVIWGGFNVLPDGGVSPELLKSQVDAKPADTQAPEEFLQLGIDRVNEAFKIKWGYPLFKHHEIQDTLHKKVHRFRALDEAGLLALAKDITRLTADSIDNQRLSAIVPVDTGKQRGSLKSVEAVLSTVISEELAKDIMAPLFGVYDLRLGDAHLPSSNIAKTKENIGLTPTLLPLQQGQQMLHCVVSVLFAIEEAVLNGEAKLVKRPKRA